ncbi:MAG: hypothetical protein Q7J78_04745 [Clostridiales bacterium]|nr:hypothetical protein [Clostridiales bacterium]
MSSMRYRAHEIIDNISEKKIAEVVDFLEYLKIKEEVEATDEILKDKKILEAIRKGLSEVKNNNLVNFDDVIENV